MTTSLIVVPVALPIARSRSIGQSWAANRRDPVIGWLRIVRGACSDSADVSFLMPLVIVLIRAPGSPAASAVRPMAVRSAWTGTSDRELSADDWDFVTFDRSGILPQGAGMPRRS